LFYYSGLKLHKADFPCIPEAHMSLYYSLGYYCLMDEQIINKKTVGNFVSKSDISLMSDIYAGQFRLFAVV
jgi:hypothetical protein